eukprot:7143869-Pyramimonas_sp.AAC.2
MALHSCSTSFLLEESHPTLRSHEDLTPKGAPSFSTTGAMRGGEKTSINATLDLELRLDVTKEPSPRHPVALAAASPRAFLTREPQATSWSSLVRSPSSHSRPTRPSLEEEVGEDR